jgi:hypothetical protein
MLHQEARTSRIANVALLIQITFQQSQLAQLIQQLNFVAAKMYQQLPSHQHGHGTALHVTPSIQMPLLETLHSKILLATALNQMQLTRNVAAVLQLNNKRLP